LKNKLIKQLKTKEKKMETIQCRESRKEVIELCNSLCGEMCGVDKFKILNIEVDLCVTCVDFLTIEMLTQIRDKSFKNGIKAQQKIIKDSLGIKEEK
jgi:hypothetical protein